MEGRELDKFSSLKFQFENFEKELEIRKLSEKIKPFEDCSEEAVKSRLEQAINSFDFFDKTYFDSSMYSDGYSKNSWFHKFLSLIYKKAGVNVVLGPRKHAKTTTLKKLFVWLILTSRIKFAATLSSTLPTSRNILNDIFNLFQSDKILFDFKPEFIEFNKDQVTLKVAYTNTAARIITLSEGRSARGASYNFIRLQFVLCDDFETRLSALSSEAVSDRIKLLQETYQSMSEDGSIAVLGNNFDERCALNRLKIEQDNNLLPPYWRVYTFKAFDKKPLWSQRFPATTEEELKRMLKIADISEWHADFQQEPTAPDGYIFQRLPVIPRYSDIPIDAKGVLYCDPNLSKKGKGDTTAIVSLVYSALEDKYYLQDFICRSFSDSNELLDSMLKMKKPNIYFIGFDGNVNQESTWSNNVRNWCLINNLPYPPIFYKRYNIDDLAKNIQMVWNDSKVLLPKSINDKKEGKVFLDQIFAFSGKKSNRKDDAPDALISAFEFLNEKKLNKRVGTTITSVFKDFFNF